ncbi:hypothetical protein TUMEXPCC7403_09775 [Tumidithrix helvetica PCC 7403]|uniref:hypothetical protein n=1 Tax=Tumidithrix helvetica TaxID=3457545 RepID=UPI003CAE3D97
MVTKTISAQDLVNQLRKYKSESERWKLLYQDTLEALQREQEAHAQTKSNLFKILGDAIAARTS